MQVLSSRIRKTLLKNREAFDKRVGLRGTKEILRNFRLTEIFQQLAQCHKLLGKSTTHLLTTCKDQTGLGTPQWQEGVSEEECWEEQLGQNL